MTKYDFHQALLKREPVAVLAQVLSDEDHEASNSRPSLMLVQDDVRDRYIDRAVWVLEALRKQGMVLLPTSVKWNWDWVDHVTGAVYAGERRQTV